LGLDDVILVGFSMPAAATFLFIEEPSRTVGGLGSLCWLR
jgi:hypothetical protein